MHPHSPNVRGRRTLTRHAIDLALHPNRRQRNASVPRGQYTPKRQYEPKYRQTGYRHFWPYHGPEPPGRDPRGRRQSVRLGRYLDRQPNSKTVIFIYRHVFLCLDRTPLQYCSVVSLDWSDQFWIKQSKSQVPLFRMMQT